MRKLLLFSWLFVAPFLLAADAPQVPADKELKVLALDSLLSFNKAIQAQDFTGFQKEISALWQAQVTPSKLKTIFQTFIDQQLDLSPITTKDPVFSEPPKIDGDGVLVLQGFYPTTPSKVDFRLKYIYEKTAWKLIGIKVDVKPSGAAGKLPSDDEAKELVQDSLLAFNAAVQTKSFVDFHKQVAVMWQKQITPTRLEELFGPFIKNEVDISAIASMEPTFDKAPSINEDGLLELKGFYPTKQAKILFDLAYLFEAPDWKLIKINVNVKPPEESAGAKATKK
jgi:hypothetical protein